MTERVDSASDPWRAPLVVAQIPETGLHREIEADEAARRGIAELAGLREVVSARGAFDVQPMSGGRFAVTGRVRARLGQTCVVTLDPIENEIDEEIDLVYAPPEQIPQLSDLVDDAVESDEETPDSPEPIVNGIIDLGRLATDAVLLAMDPYPRKPDAVFDVAAEPADPDEHPFAALRALQQKERPASPKKPK